MTSKLKLFKSTLTLLLLFYTATSNSQTPQNQQVSTSEIIRALPISEKIIYFESCKIVGQDHLICRKLGKGAYNIDDIALLQSRTSQKFWKEAIGAAVLTAGTGIAVSLFVGFPIAFAIATSSFEWSTATIMALGAGVGTGYSLLDCQGNKLNCAAVGATTGAAVAGIPFYGVRVLMLSAGALPPIAAIQKAINSIIPNIDLIGDFELMNKLGKLSIQIRDNQFHLTAIELEEILKHLNPVPLNFLAPQIP